MPFRVLLSPSDPLGVVELSGIVRWAEVAEALRVLYGHPAWAPGNPALWDARAVVALSICAGEVCPDAPSAAGTVMTEVAPARAGGRAAVVTRDVVVASLTMLTAELGPETGREVRVFTEMEAALAFLGREALPEGLEAVAAA